MSLYKVRGKKPARWLTPREGLSRIGAADPGVHGTFTEYLRRMGRILPGFCTELRFSCFSLTHCVKNSFSIS
jgi:hypothetical protein